MRFAIDTGGTFTDLVVEFGSGELGLYKAPTTSDDPVRGILDVLARAAADLSVKRRAFLADGELLIHATTHAINAILTGNTARTAFLTTEGHPDILLFREGGRPEAFDFAANYPEPYVPRALTFEVPERIAADGTVLRPLEMADLAPVIDRLAEMEVEAVGVALLWSMANPQHEMQVGALLEARLPGVPYTLSHQLNPSLREYRRASSTCIDASLKPMMAGYLNGLASRLSRAGFAGRLLMVTSHGCVMDAADVAKAPIHSIGSGPAVAPVAGRYYARADAGADTAVIADAGGTSYDVSLLRDGRIPWTRETWIGPRFLGHMTGFPSVDVRSIGAGGGSIARVDEGGLLHVGPGSAGAVPGPACYGLGGTQPTVTDAALMLGYIDPNFFLGGAQVLNVDLAVRALERAVAEPLGLPPMEAAAAVLALATENMVHAIEEVTVNQGIDPSLAVLVGGGGAAGLNIVAIARRLGCRKVVMPEVGATLSAAGALLSDLGVEFQAMYRTTSVEFDREGVNRVLAMLEVQCRDFLERPGTRELKHDITFLAETRYAHQVWEIEVPFRFSRFASDADLRDLVDDFHRTHEDLFGFRDPASNVELIGWRARAQARLAHAVAGPVRRAGGHPNMTSARPVYFASAGMRQTEVRFFEALQFEEPLTGPAIVESSFTTIVLEPGSVARRVGTGSLVIEV